MTLHALRNTIGDEDFFRILKVWAQSRAGDNVTTQQFIDLAERISGQHLGELFQTWLYTAGKPALDDTARRNHGTPPPRVPWRAWRSRRRRGCWLGDSARGVPRRTARD